MIKNYGSPCHYSDPAGFDLSSLNGDELKVYQLIRQHYLAQFLPEQEADVTEATFVIGGSYSVPAEELM